MFQTISILSVSAVLVVACVVFHGFALQAVARRLLAAKAFSFYRISLLIAFAIIAHLVEIVMFQSAYVLLIDFDQFGGIHGDSQLDWRDLFYFSAMTYTATGYGDLTPWGDLRLLATVEALTGLIMVAWTASFAFLVMQLYWYESEEPANARAHDLRSRLKRQRTKADRTNVD